MTEKRLRVAIEFQRLPFVDLRIYEQATVLREIGSGLSLQRNTWLMLESLGALQHIKPEEMFRAANRHSVQHRNGRTGELSVSHAQGGM
jgi:salicylate hydroxylase